MPEESTTTTIERLAELPKRKSMCDDCAFRPGSKELVNFILFGEGQMAAVVSRLLDHLDGRDPTLFFCHQGMESDDGHYVATVVDGEIEDAPVCGGWLETREGLFEGGEPIIEAIKQTQKLMRERVELLKKSSDPVGRANGQLLDRALRGDLPARELIRTMKCDSDDMSCQLELMFCVQSESMDDVLPTLQGLPFPQ